MMINPNSNDYLVLGIDAAWSEQNPSGIALIKGSGNHWRCLALCSSYRSFLALKGPAPCQPDFTRQPGERPDPIALLNKCSELAGGGKVDVVAVDMPLSKEKITARRVADNEVSRRFGAKGCAVHSPTPNRPGSISDELTNGFEKAGIPLVVSAKGGLKTPALIEVYPHVALLNLMGLSKRLEYKVSKASKYWPNDPVEVRYDKLLQKIESAWMALGKVIQQPVSPLMPLSGAKVLNHLKSYEDALDGVVCAWVGTTYLSGEVEPIGDDMGAIWIPTAEPQ